MSRDEINWVAVGKALAVVVVVVALFGGVFYWIGLNQVDEGYRGVHTNRGAATGDILEPDWHWVNPVTQDVKEISVRPQTYTMAADEWEGDVEENDAIVFMSDDDVPVQASVTVRYHVPEDETVAFYSEWNNLGQAEQRLIRPVTDSVVQERGSAMNATEAKSDEGRAALRTELEAALQNETGSSVVIESVQVRDIQLQPEYEQELQRIEIENAQAEQRVIEAEGKAEAEVAAANGTAKAYDIRGDSLDENEIVLKESYIDSIDKGDQIVLGTDDEGTPIMLQAGEPAGNASASGGPDVPDDPGDGDGDG